MHKLVPFALLMAACSVVATTGHAAGLQVAPALVEIPGNAGMVWLDNANTRPMRAQVRVYRWVQEDNEDKLIDTEDLIASPPFINVPTDKRQVVRLVRFGGQDAATAPCEQSFRVIVDELPDFTEEETRQGMNYVLRYSVPVFLINPKCANSAPQLRWTIVQSGDQAWLDVSNAGLQRAQLANVNFVAADGAKTVLAPGLMGYVLPGAQRRFALKLASATGLRDGEIEVQLNGSQVRQPVALSIPRN